MDIYQLAVAKSTPAEIAELLREMATESEKYRKAIAQALNLLDDAIDVNMETMCDSDVAKVLRKAL